MARRLIPAKGLADGGKPRFRCKAGLVWTACCLLPWLLAFGGRLDAAVIDSPIKATLGGVSPGGFYAMAGQAIGEMAQREYPGSSVVYEPGNQAGHFVQLVAGRIELSLVSPLDLSYALQGREPFPRAFARDDFRVIGRVVDNMTAFVVASAEFLDKYDIHSLSDVARRRAPIRTYFAVRGNVMAQALLVDQIFAGAGLTAEAVRDWRGRVYYVGSVEAQRLMGDRKLDMFPTAAFHPDAKILELARSLEVRALPIDRDLVDAAARVLGLQTLTIPAGTYDFQHEDYYSLAVPMFVIATPDFADDQAYKLTKALYNQFEHFRGLHPAFGGYRREMLPGVSGYPLHEASKRFYREVGLLD